VNPVNNHPVGGLLDDPWTRPGEPQRPAAPSPALADAPPTPITWAQGGNVSVGAGPGADGRPALILAVPCGEQIAVRSFHRKEAFALVRALLDVAQELPE
jgi:hypothetical protein